MNVLNPTELKSNVGGVLDRAIDAPQYVLRNGQLLVITRADLVPARENELVAPWEVRAATIESFYDSNKAW